jgi:hypothetical protein
MKISAAGDTYWRPGPQTPRLRSLPQVSADTKPPPLEPSSTAKQLTRLPRRPRHLCHQRFGGNSPLRSTPSLPLMTTSAARHTYWRPGPQTPPVRSPPQVSAATKPPPFEPFSAAKQLARLQLQFKTPLPPKNWGKPSSPFDTD